MALDLLRSLTAVVAEENAALQARTWAAVPAELAAAKARLVGQAEAATTRGDWATALDGAGREEAAELLAALAPALALNAELLKRRLTICGELMDAVGAEARRLTGGRSVTYGAAGRVAQTDRAAPIAINTSL